MQAGFGVVAEKNSMIDWEKCRSVFLGAAMCVIHTMAEGGCWFKHLPLPPSIDRVRGAVALPHVID